MPVPTKSWARSTSSSVSALGRPGPRSDRASPDNTGDPVPLPCPTDDEDHRLATCQSRDQSGDAFSRASSSRSDGSAMRVIRVSVMASLRHHHAPATAKWSITVSHYILDSGT